MIGDASLTYIGSVTRSGGVGPAPSVMMAYKIKAESLRYFVPSDGMAYEIKAASLTYKIEV